MSSDQFTPMDHWYIFFYQSIHLFVYLFIFIYYKYPCRHTTAYFNLISFVCPDITWPSDPRSKGISSNGGDRVLEYSSLSINAKEMKSHMKLVIADTLKLCPFCTNPLPCTGTTIILRIYTMAYQWIYIWQASQKMYISCGQFRLSVW